MPIHNQIMRASQLHYDFINKLAQHACYWNFMFNPTKQILYSVPTPLSFNMYCYKNNNTFELLNSTALLTLPHDTNSSKSNVYVKSAISFQSTILAPQRVLTKLNIEIPIVETVVKNLCNFVSCCCARPSRSLGPLPRISW